MIFGDDGSAGGRRRGPLYTAMGVRSLINEGLGWQERG